MLKQISLIVLTGATLIVGFAINGAPRSKVDQPVTQIQPVSQKQQDQFRDKLLSEIQGGQESTKKAYDSAKQPTSDYAPMFAQNVASATNPNSRTFNPKIKSGGLTYDGKHFTVIVENGSSEKNSDFVITGTLSSNGTITNVKVDAL